MASLPTISGRQARDALLKDGWTFARQRGSHMILIKPGHIASLSVQITRNSPKAPSAACSAAPG